MMLRPGQVLFSNGNGQDGVYYIDGVYVTLKGKESHELTIFLSLHG